MMSLSLKNLIAGSVFAVALIGGWNHHSYAIPITWNLQNVLFDDGGTASGSLCSMRISAPTAVFSPSTFDNIGNFIVTYGDPLPASPGNNIVLIAIPDDTVADLTNGPLLALNFASALTNAGGLIDILPGFDPNFSFESACLSADCGSFDDNDFIREVTAGQVAAPEPGTLALFGIGIIGIGVAVRRRRKAA